MFQKYKKRKRDFSKEFKDNLRVGLNAAIGFTIAFAWREPFILFANNFVKKYVESTTIYHTSIITAFAVTFFGVLLIWVLSRILK